MNYKLLNRSVNIKKPLPLSSDTKAYVPQPVKVKRYQYRGNHKKREHVRIAETVLGKTLPSGAEVHHVNEDGLDNRHENLVICENRHYHRLLHVRQRIVDAGGDPNTDAWCTHCGQVKPRCQFYRLSRTANGLMPICKRCEH